MPGRASAAHCPSQVAATILVVGRDGVLKVLAGLLELAQAPVREATEKERRGIVGVDLDRLRQVLHRELGLVQLPARVASVDESMEAPGVALNLFRELLDRLLDIWRLLVGVEE